MNNLPVITACATLSEPSDKYVVVLDDYFEKKCLTYSVLHKFREDVESCLTEKQCQREVIGIASGQALFQPAFILGVMGVGGAFYSIDPNGPVTLITTYIKQFSIRIILFDDDNEVDRIIPHLKPYHPIIECFTVTDGLTFKCLYLQNVIGSKLRSPLAYIIATSGTTGTQKVVRVPYSCVAPNVEYFREKFKIVKDDVIVQASPMTFDPSIVNILLAISSGACLLVVPESLKLQPSKLTEVLVRNRASVIQATPTISCSQATPTLLSSLFSNITLRDHLTSDTCALRVVASGGEKCPTTAVLNKWRSQKASLQFFNVYGITEVSSWATCYQVTSEDLSRDTEVPLGEAMFNTELAIRDEHGQESDVGELFIGGAGRVCFLGDEETVEPTVLRATGDVVRRNDTGNLFYKGRRDVTVKRHGMRMNLFELEQVCSAVNTVQCAVAVLDEAKRLLLFLQASPDAANTVQNDVKAHLKDNLPKHYMPDETHVIKHVPMTSHGKVNRKLLLQTARACSRDCEDEFDVLQLLCASVDVSLQNIDVSKTLLEYGVNSFAALSCIQALENGLRVSLPSDMFEKLMSLPINALTEWLKDHSIIPKRHNTKRRLSPVVKRMSDDAKRLKSSPDTTPIAFQAERETTPNTSHIEGETCERQTCSKQFISVQRTGIIQCNGLNYRDERCKPTDIMTLQAPGDIENADVIFKVKFKYDLGRCIDASPLLCSLRVSPEVTRDFVVIGSHAHRLAAIDAHSGDALWDIELGDRIESSACMSACGNYVVVGCYDGCCYVIDAMNGTKWWKFKTGGSVKSSPCCDDVTGFIFCGSHDQHVYALNIQQRTCAWKFTLDGGSVFSSPVVCTDPHQVIAASLSGLIVALNPRDGAVHWRCQFEKPVFSSPAVHNDHIYIGCADGSLYCLSTRGSLVWSFTTKAPIFSSPCVWSAQHMISKITHEHQTVQTNSADSVIVFGSHDHCVYCLAPDGSVHWTFESTTPVYSSPLVTTLRFESVVDSSDQDCSAVLTVVVVSDVIGTLYLFNIDDGRIVAKFSFANEVFSSAVTFKGKLYVGCRDDFLYCLEL